MQQNKTKQNKTKTKLTFALWEDNRKKQGSWKEKRRRRRRRKREREKRNLLVGGGHLFDDTPCYPWSCTSSLCLIRTLLCEHHGSPAHQGEENTSLLGHDDTCSVSKSISHLKKTSCFVGRCQPTKLEKRTKELSLSLSLSLSLFPRYASPLLIEAHTYRTANAFTFSSVSLLLSLLVP